jgi:hypothetical protein
MARMKTENAHVGKKWAIIRNTAEKCSSHIY